MGVPALVPSFGVALLAAALLGASRTAFLGVQAALLGEAVAAALRGPVLALSGTINQIAQVVGILGGAAVAAPPRVRAAPPGGLVPLLAPPLGPLSPAPARQPAPGAPPR